MKTLIKLQKAFGIDNLEVGAIVVILSALFYMVAF